eukprot:gene25946-biopygen12074
MDSCHEEDVREQSRAGIEAADPASSFNNADPASIPAPPSSSKECPPDAWGSHSSYLPGSTTSLTNGPLLGTIYEACQSTTELRVE